MKKLIAVLCTDDWQPEIRAMTFPLFRYHAAKIGADFHVINDRKFPSSYPLCYERFQFYEISKKKHSVSNGEKISLFFFKNHLFS